MKKTYVKPVITIIELPKNNFIATSGPSFGNEDVEGAPGFDDDSDPWYFGFD